MKVKFRIWQIILVIILIISLFIGYKIFKFNSISSNVEIFHTTSNEEAKFFGVISNNYYKLENDRLKAFDAEGAQVFDMEAKDVKDILYNKYIYVIHNDGKIEKLDRFTGEQKSSEEFDVQIRTAKFIDNKIILYCNQSVIILNDSLKKEKEIENLSNPVNFSIEGSRYSVIELSLLNNDITSKFSIYNGDDLEFNISSIDELFLRTETIDGKTYLFTNRYIYIIEKNSISKKVIMTDVSAIDIKDDNITVIDNKELISYDKNLDINYRKQIGMDVDVVKILRNSTFMLNQDLAKVYENENLIEDNVDSWIQYYSRGNEFYMIFKDKIQRVNAY